MAGLDNFFILLIGATFLASALQAATGLGFGVVAGPLILIALDGREAMQVSAALNLLIALLLAPRQTGRVDRTGLNRLLVGMAFGLPLGAAAFAFADPVHLKFAAAVAVTGVLASLFAAPRPGTEASRRREGIFSGLVAGGMGACLAMPGPPAAVYLARAGRGKDVVRATVLTFFLFAYAAALALQTALDGASGELLRVCAALAPATVLGIVAGQALAGHISERAFSLTLKVVLAATTASLLLSGLRDLA